MSTSGALLEVAYSKQEINNVFRPGDWRLSQYSRLGSLSQHTAQPTVPGRLYVAMVAILRCPTSDVQRRFGLLGLSGECELFLILRLVREQLKSSFVIRR
jgi:hypothetical protein